MATAEQADNPTVQRPTFEIRRRTFLLGGGGLGLGLALAGCDGLGLGSGNAQAATSQFGAYIDIAEDGLVTIVTPGAEMGQGVSSTLPKIVAEELGADWSKVKIALSGVDPAFYNPGGRLRSANSDAVINYFEPLRKVGASAREMLVAAAAARWEADAADITVADGVLTNGATGDTLTFAEVARDAADLPIPENPTLKDPADFALIGKTSPRKDIPEKVFGTAVFGLDVDLPDMLHAAIRHVPVAGAKLGKFDAEKAKSMPGVHEIVPMDNAIAVIADSYWQAQQAVDAIALGEPEGTRPETAALTEAFRAALDDDDAALAFPYGGTREAPLMSAELGVVRDAISGAARQVEFEYSLPYLAHATMEPMCATALVEPGRCEIWAPTQAGDAIPPEVAAATGIAEGDIKINRTYIGGGFGRKNERDFMIEAVKAAQAKPGRPVKLIWTRKEDTQHDLYRPGLAARFRAGIDGDGTIKGMHGRLAGQPLSGGKAFRVPGMADASVSAGLVSANYDMGERRIDMVEVEAPIRTSFWRAVSGSNNGFFSEAIIDDIAALVGKDPYEYRLARLAENSRLKAVAELAAQKAGWGTPMGAGRGRGFALANGWNSPIAQVIEVTVKGQQLTVDRVVCAFDCGLAVDPDNVISQIEGGIVFGLSAALFGKITFKDGVVEQESYNEYPVVTFANMPDIEVHLIRTDDQIGGVGEAGLPPVAPALTAAIHDATGTRVRSLPIVDAGFEVAR